MKKNFKDILITGATGDIAQALVKLLAEDKDVRLHLLSRDLQKLEQLYGGLPNACFYQEGVSPLPEVDILVNNAGTAVFEAFEELTMDDIEAMFEVNSLLAIRHIKESRPRIQIVNIASIAGKLPTAKSTAYSASKAALIAFSDALRMERPDLIITTVNTGPVRTKFHADNPAYLERVGSYVLTADEIAVKIYKQLGRQKAELNLPWQLALLVKLRGLFPRIFDGVSLRFFNYK
ncbi:SDR family NAD(P)-dependent oxidoreductase [Lactococcus termiticola]|uniref:Short-chain dehydrogenase n=1 Tax=Lactococcus termiticola TaxID=2169526 RepID=A0A2R5HG58_9LACT|nr:SDR family NAD(P)-dependent oxidoreductase [Lactococcus termiticola]GBG96972.1 short-chain dehydrogenase [Lactococcus termiticola]